MSILKKLHIGRKKVKFYGIVSLAFVVLSTLGSLAGSNLHILQLLVNNIWQISFLVILHYLFLEWVLHLFKLTWLGVLKLLWWIFVFLMLYGFGQYAWVHLGVFINIFRQATEYASWEQEMEDLMANSMGSLFFFGIIWHFHNFRNLRVRAQQLQIEKQHAELNYLKSQTNPHFLFNTLNNIFSLAREKSDLAAESIMRLSKILRYMLYETGEKYTSIEGEMKIIEDYIALEKLRYDGSLKVKYYRDIEDRKQAIPPLILIPLVENAFKHGASETRSNPFVNIHLSIHNRVLRLVVRNSIEASNSGDGIREKIGLSNLKRQLELLYGEFDLSVKQEESEFTASLNINLASHVEY